MYAQRIGKPSLEIYKCNCKMYAHIMMHVYTYIPCDNKKNHRHMYMSMNTAYFLYFKSTLQAQDGDHHNPLLGPSRSMSRIFLLGRSRTVCFSSLTVVCYYTFYSDYRQDSLDPYL